MDQFYEEKLKITNPNPGKLTKPTTEI